MKEKRDARENTKERKIVGSKDDVRGGENVMGRDASALSVLN